MAKRKRSPELSAERAGFLAGHRGMLLLFALVVAGCMILLGLHVLAARAPRSRDVLGQVPIVHAFAIEPDRSVVQVDPGQIERIGGPLADALRDNAQITIAGCRFRRTADGEYRYAGWAAEAVLIVRPTATGRLVEVSYALRTKY